MTIHGLPGAAEEGGHCSQMAMAREVVFPRQSVEGGATASVHTRSWSAENELFAEMEETVGFHRDPRWQEIVSMASQSRKFAGGRAAELAVLRLQMADP
jgi:hypothetical protein